MKWNAYDVDYCVDDTKIELDVRTAWKIYELLLSASMFMPDASAHSLSEWQGGDDIDMVRILHAHNDARLCECYAGAIRGLICKAMSPKRDELQALMDKYENSNKEETEDE